MWSLGVKRRMMREHWWHADWRLDDPAGGFLECVFCGLRTRLMSPPETPCSRREHDHAHDWLLADGSISADTAPAAMPEKVPWRHAM
jgi:hypothetical protein